MTESREQVETSRTYSGSGISVRSLEETIAKERKLQNEHISDLGTLRGKNADLQRALSEELKKLEDVRRHLERERSRDGFMADLRRSIAKLPFFKGRIVTRSSVEALLRQQYELSTERLKEAAEFADRLTAAKRDLFDEVDRLNEKIIESAKNERVAAQTVLELNGKLETARAKEAAAGPGTVEAREFGAEIDRIERELTEHSAKLELYDTAEERLDRLKDSTRHLADTIGHLARDLTAYVTVASEKLDLIGGQIQAIGAAADASLVLLELQASLESLTESVNYTTRFVSETQVYFSEQVDGMVEELSLYDEETEKVLAKNAAMNQLSAEMRIAEAVTTALAKAPGNE